MWRDKELFSYIKAVRFPELLFCVYIVGILTVYGLYGLPEGPALYTVLLLMLVSAAAWGKGYVRYRRRNRILKSLLKNEYEEAAELSLEYANETERLYGELLFKCRKEKEEIRLQAEEERKRADAYYTRWSHQIKTPVSVMELLLQEEEPDKDALRQELFKTGQYIGMALSYQKLGKKDGDLRFSHFQASALVKQAVIKTSSLFIHKKIGVLIEENLDFDILTDEKWFVFILEQVLTNAVKYTKEGTVRIGSPEKGMIAVEDTGIGILPEDLPRVFEWGYTGYNGRIDKRSTGIGLSLVKMASELLGHRVSISSDPGKGTRVLIETAREELVTE